MQIEGRKIIIDELKIVDHYGIVTRWSTFCSLQSFEESYSSQHCVQWNVRKWSEFNTHQFVNGDQLPLDIILLDSTDEVLIELVHDTPSISCSSQTDLYIFVDQSLSWIEAEFYCETVFDTTLATISNGMDMQILLNLTDVKNKQTWIGLHDKYGQGLLYWIDGTVYNLIPNVSAKRNDNYNFGCCVYLNEEQSTDFSAAYCNETKMFICNGMCFCSMHV